jgi:hypothetical protein
MGNGKANGDMEKLRGHRRHQEENQGGKEQGKAVRAGSLNPLSCFLLFGLLYLRARFAFFLRFWSYRSHLQWNLGVATLPESMRDRPISLTCHTVPAVLKSSLTTAARKDLLVLVCGQENKRLASTGFRSERLTN